MTIPELFKSISERVQTAASVKTVYGEPVSAEGKTIIPVARVAYGFGAGGGSRGSRPEEDVSGEVADEGGGGGGGVSVNPIGVIEITAGETRFISFEERRQIIRAALLGAVVGLFLLRRRLRR